MNQHDQQAQLSSINIHQFQEKCKSKKELYQFLQQDCRAFLPRIQSTNIYFFKQIIRGEKEVIKSFLFKKHFQHIKREQVKVSAVPHIEGLTIDDFLEYSQENPLFLRYLPDQRDWVHMDRQWICDLLFSLDSDGIQQMINTALRARKERLEKNRDLLVEMKPEFVQALNQCINFSCIFIKFLPFILEERGKSTNLLKGNSKRKRLHSELNEVKSEENELKLDRQAFLQKVKRLRMENEQLTQQIQEVNQANVELQQFIEEEKHSEQQVIFEI